MPRSGDRNRPGRRPRGRPRAILLAAACLALACEPDAAVASPLPLPPRRPAPLVVTSSVTGNPGNVLGATVVAHVRFADSVAVRYGLAGTTPDSATPAVPTLGDSALIPVLGLLPDRDYTLQVVAYGGGRITVGDTVTLRTDRLPTDLPSYVAGGSDPSPGYVVFAMGNYGLVIDNTGRVVWYHRFAYGAGLAFAAQPTGRYTARPATPEPTDPHVWVEIDPLGTMTRTFDCARGLEPRLHDLIAELDGSYWLMCDETRVMDLSGIGGVASAQVTGTVIQHLSREGVLLFEWSPFDHFAITDLDAGSRTGSTVNWTHGNALDLDTDGNLVVSFRNLSEITKIDTRTGDVLWRLGGVRNEFTFAGTSAPAFARQHGVRLAADGGLLLLDNLGDPTGSRAERYGYDPALRAARLLAAQEPTPTVTAQLGGSVQELPGGRTLVSYGTGARVEEYDAAGRVVWRIEGAPGYVFRAQRIRSLYAPGVGLSR